MGRNEDKHRERKENVGRERGIKKGGREIELAVLFESQEFFRVEVFILIHNSVLREMATL